MANCWSVDLVDVPGEPRRVGLVELPARWAAGGVGTIGVVAYVDVVVVERVSLGGPSG
ncbi:MAG: hypothetical protein AAF467_18050 [Actinomycetota bacterium]